MSMEAVQTFLHGPATSQTLKQLLDVVPIRSICATIIHAESTPQRLQCSEALNRALGVDGFGEKYVVLATLRYLRNQADPEARELLEFLQLLVNQESEEIRYNVYSRILPVLCEAVASAALIAPDHNIEIDWLQVDQDVVHNILLPLFDSEETLLAEMVARSILSAFEGRILTIRLDADAFVTAWGLEASSAPNIEAHLREWRHRKITGRLGLELTQLIPELEVRLKGKLDVKAVPRPWFSADTVRVRAASLLIKLTDCTPWLRERCIDEGWYAVIMQDIFYSDDLLLRLSAGQLIIEEIVHTPTGLGYIFQNGWHKRLAADLHSEGTSNATLRTALLRVLANILAEVPESREDILDDRRSHFLSMVATSLRASKSDPDYDVLRTTAISCIGCVAHGLDPEGLAALRITIPTWMEEMTWCLKHGTESELLACLAALTRVFKKAKVDKEEFHVYEETFVPPILTILIEKSFPLQVELSYRVLLEMLQSGMRTPLTAFCQRSDLQKQLFVPLYSDPPSVKYAKHDFVSVAVNGYRKVLDECGNNVVRDAFKAYAAGNPFVPPPQYKDDSVIVADKTES